MPAIELSADHDMWLTTMSDHLRGERYSREGKYYVSIARRFLLDIQTKSLTVHDVKPVHVEKHLRNITRIGKSAQNTNVSDGQRQYCRAAVHMLLRLVHGKWPPEVAAATEQEHFHQRLIKEYDLWMMELRGLHPKTRSQRCSSALHFLEWIGNCGSEDALRQITIADIDRYIQWRMRPLRRTSKRTVTVHLRSFLRHLHGTGRIPDLEPRIIVPKVYENEDIPSALRPGEIDRVLRYAKADRSPIGLRDYAILVLLSTYGLRAGEITALRLEDIDWTHDRLRIYHAKTGVHSELPLLREPGEAIINYLRAGRPETTQREVFLRACAPYRALTSQSLHTVLQPRLAAARVVPEGKRGPHAFRHAKAASLLRVDVPLKVIGDVLAHRSTQSTMAYLKLDLEKLRGIGLEIPGSRP